MKRIFKKSQSTSASSPTRITNETVAEHREQILAGGRKFKYPVQYARHRLVINTIIIGVAFLILMTGIIWQQLYAAQATNSFFYRVTRTVPVPVASVDGHMVRYSDYLMRYRSQEHWLAAKGQAEQGKADSERQSQYIKRTILDGVELDAYAAKLAAERDITVSEEEINTVVERNLQTPSGAIPQENYDASLRDTLGYERDEYRLLLQQSLVREKVAYVVDEKAQGLADRILPLVKKDGSNFATIVQQIGSDVAYGESGVVRTANQDGGLTRMASQLDIGQVSEPLKSTTADGYYFIRLLTKADQQLSYEFIKVPLTTFREQFDQLKKDGKIKEYISIEESSSQTIE